MGAENAPGSGALDPLTLGALDMGAFSAPARLRLYPDLNQTFLIDSTHPQLHVEL